MVSSFFFSCPPPAPTRPFYAQGDDGLEEEGLDWDELEKRAKRDDSNKRDWDGEESSSKQKRRKR